MREHLRTAIGPITAVLAVAGAVFALELAAAFAADEVPAPMLVVEGRIALRRMFVLACALAAPIAAAACLSGRPLRPSRLARRTGAVLAGAFAAAWLAALLWPAQDARSPRPDVWLVVVDTLRADYVTPERTPHLERLAREGVRFPRAYASAPWTLPSFGTLLTGRYPRSHGAGVEGERGSSRGPLRPDVETLAERFAGAGYQTVALTTNPHLRADNGLGRGFEIYRNLMRDDGRFGATFPLFSQARFAPASLQTDRALAWLGLRDPERPLFVLLHYMDAHLPRTPERGLLAAERAAAPEASPEQWAYGAMVRAVDREVGRLLEGLDEAEGLEHSVVAFTSDHGEGLEPGGERWSHGNSLYPELVRAPLAIRLPGATAAGSDCPGIATHLDLGATLLGLAGLPPRLGEGRPMLGRDGRCAAPRGAVFQSMASEGPTRDAVTSEQLALVWSRPDRFEAFDPAADPQQRQPLESAPPEWIARLRAHVERENDRAARAGAAAPVEIGAEARSQLRELGYLE